MPRRGWREASSSTSDAVQVMSFVFSSGGDFESLRKVQERRFTEELVGPVYIHEYLPAALGETGYFNSSLQDHVDASCGGAVLIVDDLSFPILHDLGVEQVIQGIFKRPGGLRS